MSPDEQRWHRRFSRVLWVSCGVEVVTEWLCSLQVIVGVVVVLAAGIASKALPVSFAHGPLILWVAMWALNRGARSLSGHYAQACHMLEDPKVRADYMVLGIVVTRWGVKALPGPASSWPQPPGEPHGQRKSAD